MIDVRMKRPNPPYVKDIAAPVSSSDNKVVESVRTSSIPLVGTMNLFLEWSQTGFMWIR